MGRKRGIDDFGWQSHQPKKSRFDFQGVKGVNSAHQLGRPMPWKDKFRPDFNLKDFSILYDYNYASLWTRWRRGYELYMYANQAYVGLNYSFKYFVSGRAGQGVGLPGICYMYPSTDQDMGMRMVAIRPRDSFNFLDFGYAIASVTPYQDDIIAVRLTSNFGAPISFFTGEVLSDRFNADGTQKTTYNNYTVVGVGFNNQPRTPTFAPTFDTLFLSTGLNNSWSVIDTATLSAPAQSLPTPGDYFTTEMRFSCNCPDYLGREDFNLYKYNLKRRYPYTLPQDLKEGSYDVGKNFDPDRVTATRDYPGYTRDFGFLYVKRVLDLPRYTDSATTYSDPNMFYYAPRWCKHIYASFWDMQKRLTPNQPSVTQPWLAQPTDEPMDDRYREMFDRELHKQTTFENRQKNLRWWERYSPSINNIQVHMMYPDMHPTMVKALNFDTLASGVSTPMTASGFQMFTLDQFNPFAPADAATQDRVDGGTYAFGVLTSGSVNIYDGGTYAFGLLIPPPSQPSTLNGGTY
jgi:hypothetical protein